MKHKHEDIVRRTIGSTPRRILTREVNGKLRSLAYFQVNIASEIEAVIGEITVIT